MKHPVYLNYTEAIHSLLFFYNIALIQNHKIFDEFIILYIAYLNILLTLLTGKLLVQILTRYNTIFTNNIR